MVIDLRLRGRRQQRRGADLRPVGHELHLVRRQDALGAGVRRPRNCRAVSSPAAPGSRSASAAPGASATRVRSRPSAGRRRAAQTGSCRPTRRPAVLIVLVEARVAVRVGRDLHQTVVRVAELLLRLMAAGAGTLDAGEVPVLIHGQLGALAIGTYNIARIARSCRARFSSHCGPHSMSVSQSLFGGRDT